MRARFYIPVPWQGSWSTHSMRFARLIIELLQDLPTQRIQQAFRTTFSAVAALHHSARKNKHHMHRKLIITADDYGMCETVNQAIEECLAVGTVRATCVMTNMPAYRTTESLRVKFSQSSLGIHWTLTEGRPVLPPAQVPSLVRPDGTLYPPVQFRQRWRQRRVNTMEIRAELRAQYQRFHETAGQPDFWNSHQNFPIWPGLFQICVALGQRLRIPRMRSHRRYTVPRDRTAITYYLSHPVSWLKSQVINRWARHARSQGMLMPDGLVHMPGYGDRKR